ncbi:MAG TPA: ubiquinol-cytochrome C chaperone family protein [Xanthobacteraceae bacterium]|jgi:cytochrome b pre-mRNA-processing protein 3|nr:ubiquinol-cytochrome C chaperone family protein [Xanthobacteraceae bacterium]
MMFHFFRRGSRDDSIAALYGTIVAQARAAPFYRNCGVPDTVNGRFEMLVLHLVLVLRRLEPEEQARRLGQALFDWFCRDMDGSLREMGVGDLAVPGKMRRIGEAFYGRQAAYAAALSAPDASLLAAALERNVFAEADSRPGADMLAAYARAAAAKLAAQSLQAICRAEFAFPDPSGIAISAAVESGSESP